MLIAYYIRTRDAEFTVRLSDIPACDGECVVDFFVENLGRSNFGKPHQFEAQRKGLVEEVLLNGQEITDWEIFALEFKSDWVQSLSGWSPYNRDDHLEYSPRVLRGTLEVVVAPEGDTYFDFNCQEPGCSDWLHGALFVNGFNVGRFWRAGPQKTLYVPGPLLKQGTNEFVVMENYLGSDELRFAEAPFLGNPNPVPAEKTDEV